MNPQTSAQIQSELSASIPYKWRLKSVTNKAQKPYPAGTRGQFLAYIQARDVFNRLDAVLGLSHWQSSVKRINEDGSAVVALSIRIDGEWITREDVGYPNNPGAGVEDEPLKAAISDGIKRAAVHFGIGRFLYDLPARWVDIDQHGQPVKPLGTTVVTPTSVIVAENPVRKETARTVWAMALDRGWNLAELNRFAVAELGAEPGVMTIPQLEILRNRISAVALVAAVEMAAAR